MRMARSRTLLRFVVLNAVALAIWLCGAPRAAAVEQADVAALFAPQAIGTVEPASGQPPVAVVRADDGRIIAFGFSTREVAGSVGYSGRPLDIVAAVTPDGIIAGAKIVAHEEPILVIGIPREAIATYVASFKGFDVRSDRGLAGAAAPGPKPVAGASVTSAVIRDAIVRSARAVLHARGATDVAGRPRLDRESRRRSSWPALVAEGAVRRLLVTRGEAARLLGTRDDEPDKTFIELWLAVATPAAIGESLLGQRIYERAVARIGADDDLILVAANGLYSFRGLRWQRSGVFDRIEIVQGGKSIRLQAADHERIDSLHAAGAPEFREISLFRVPRSSGFDATAPFRLDLDLAQAATATPLLAPIVVSLDYRIPEAYVIAPAAAAAAGDDGTASAAAQPAAQPPLWTDIWWRRRYELAALAFMLAGLGAILIFQNLFTAQSHVYRRIRRGYLVVTFVFLGLFANAQLSVVNVVTFVHALLSGFRWELFLLDPLVFVLWSFVAVSMLFWGRGVFCGWLCPFGALQELLNECARRLGVKQVAVPFGLHERLWMIKYVLFLGILAVSLHSIMDAFRMAEVEPFKTAITMKFMRDWPLVLYVAALLAAGLLIERFYCRYLCVLGAALAIPARMRMFEWLKRYRECGAECQVCARTCTVQAIHPLGQINPNECIYCLKCQANYLDGNVCIHIKKRMARRQPRPAAPGRDQPAAAGGGSDGH